MGDPVEGFGEVEVNAVTRPAVVNIVCDVIEERQEVGSAGATREEAMLRGVKETSRSEVTEDSSFD